MAKRHSRPRARRLRHELGSCQDCGVTLDAENWYWFGKAYRRYSCKPCWIDRQRAYKANARPETVEARKERRNKLARERRAANPWDHRDRQWRRNYGIDLEGYLDLLDKQGGGCAICRGGTNGRGVFHVDHCHDTGKVRGLLCAKCNILLGHADDDTARLRAAIAYLIDPPA